MTTIISHIYNEAFLLPFFIEQHYAKFDHGVILDFGSTDDSRSIIEKLAPKWKIIDCSHHLFEAAKVDYLVAELESKIQGTTVALTATEFLIGDPRLISTEAIIPTVSLLRLPGEPEIRIGQKFHDVYKNGVFPFQAEVNLETEWMSRKKGRKIGGVRSEYPVGRHFDLLGDSLLLIYRVSNCLASEEMIQRRLQIQNRVPDSEIAKGFAIQHTDYGRGLTRDSLLNTIKAEVKFSENLTEYIQMFLELEKFTLGIDESSHNFKFLKNIFSKFEYNQKLWKENFTENSIVQRNFTENSIVQRNFTENSIVRSLESDLISQYTRMKEIELEYDFLQLNQKRPVKNLQDFFHNFYPAVKVRVKQIVQTLRR
jgi:hypothetical protein